jgi:hypothetical protein
MVLDKTSPSALREVLNYTDLDASLQPLIRQWLGIKGNNHLEPKTLKYLG